MLDRNTWNSFTVYKQVINDRVIDAIEQYLKTFNFGQTND